jgi:hypothetical protein
MSKRTAIGVSYGAPGDSYGFVKAIHINTRITKELLSYLTDPRDEVSEAAMSLIRALGYECRTILNDKNDSEGKQ